MRLIDRIVILGMLLWLGSMLVERVGEEIGRIAPEAAPPAREGRPALALPRGPADRDGLPELARGRVAELPVEHPRRGGHHQGTAWHIGAGRWLSARHVMDSCDLRRLGPADRPRLGRVWRHPDADLTAFESATPPRALALAAAPPRRGDAAYAIGFPKGRAGVVEVTLIGAAYMHLTGAVASVQPFRYLLWQIGSLPQHIPDPGALGGLSGGPVVDGEGRAVALAFSTVPRRALLGAIPYGDIRRAAAAATGGPRDGASARMARLVEDGAVARVVCRS